MKRGGYLQRRTPLKRHTALKQHSSSDVAKVKENIQALIREIVILRDGGCIFRDPDIQARFDLPPCNGYAKDGHLILQADHLVTRANSASYADPRLVVCACKGHHGWKSVGGNRRKAIYDEAVRKIIEPERVALWDRMEADERSKHGNRYALSDWKKEEAYLLTQTRNQSLPGLGELDESAAS